MVELVPGHQARYMLKVVICLRNAPFFAIAAIRMASFMFFIVLEQVAATKWRRANTQRYR